MPDRLPMRYSAYVLLFPVWVGFAAGVYVYLPWPSCRAAKAHRQVTDTQTGKSSTYALYRVVTVGGDLRIEIHRFEVAPERLRVEERSRR